MIDLDILKLMRDGGIKLCDYAVEQWTSGKYRCSPDQTMQAIHEWDAKAQRIREAFDELKERNSICRGKLPTGGENGKADKPRGVHRTQP